MRSFSIGEIAGLVGSGMSDMQNDINSTTAMTLRAPQNCRIAFHRENITDFHSGISRVSRSRPARSQSTFIMQMKPVIASQSPVRDEDLLGNGTRRFPTPSSACFKSSVRNETSRRRSKDWFQQESEALFIRHVSFLLTASSFYARRPSKGEIGESPTLFKSAWSHDCRIVA